MSNPKVSLIIRTNNEERWVTPCFEALYKQTFQDFEIVVVDNESNAVYFSREPIPSRKKDFEDVPMLKQICVIPFQRDYLLEFNNTPETVLERIESVDMLRVIESGGTVRMVMTEFPSIGVDTPSDLETVEKLMASDSLMLEYLP